MAKTKISSVEQFDEAWAKSFRPVYTSSAKNFDAMLRENRIQPPFKIFYEYVLPGNLKSWEFEKLLKPIHGHLLIDAKRVTDFFDIDDQTVQKIREIRKKDLITIKNWVDEIQHKNKELAGIYLEDDYDRAGLIDGACYGFSPEEINYYLEDQRNKSKGIKSSNLEKKYSDELEAILGQSITYKMSPDRLKAILETTKVKKSDFLEGGVKIVQKTPVDVFGREDPTGFLNYYEQKTRGDD